MKINFKVLGAGLLSAGPVLLNLAPAQAIWWLGIGCVVVGPVLMAVEPVKPSRKRKPK